jgi:ubiquitin-conjugating enzyme E2 variant
MVLTSTWAGVAGAVLLADFVSGIVHWAEDAYARFKPARKLPLINTIALENELHHRRPREFLARSWWASSWDLALIGAAVVWAACAMDRMSAAVLVFVVLAVNANQIHKWTHRNPRENPWWVTRLQRCYVLQTPRHHSRHHQGEKNTHYCVVTNFLNPLLEEVGFWRRLEALVARVIRRKVKPSH